MGFNENTVAWIALIVSVISPTINTFLTIFLNNRYQTKIRNMDFYYTHRAEVIENYIKSTGEFIKSKSYDAEQYYGKSLAEIYMYVPEELWQIIDDINDAIFQHDYEKSNNLLRSFSKQLRKYRPRFKI